MSAIAPLHPTANQLSPSTPSKDWRVKTEIGMIFPGPEYVRC